jgi:hypothetical protein
LPQSIEGLNVSNGPPSGAVAPEGHRCVASIDPEAERCMKWPACVGAHRYGSAECSWE